MNRVCHRNLDLLLCIAVLAMPGWKAHAQPVAPAVQESGTAAKTQPENQEQQTTTDAPKVEEKKGEWLFAPIPISSPAIGSGLEWAVARLFPINKKDEISPPSTVGIGGLFTNNGSRALAVG